MLFDKLLSIFFDRDNKIIRDYLGASAAVIALATMGTTLIANYVGLSSSDNDKIKISTVPSGQIGTRTYSEVRSVLDGEIGASSLTTIEASNGTKSVLDDEILTGSTFSQANRMRLDPCTLSSKN